MEVEYKQIKVKAAVKRNSKNDPTMGLVQEFEQPAVDKGHQSLVKETIRFGEDMGVSLDLQYSEPKCSDSRGNKVPRENIKNLRPSNTGNIFRATCRATMLRCNLRWFVARITTFLRNKFSCCKR